MKLPSIVFKNIHKFCCILLFLFRLYSDGVIRVFTSDEKRTADAETLAVFESEVNASGSKAEQYIGGVKVSEYVPSLDLFQKFCCTSSVLIIVNLIFI